MEEPRPTEVHRIPMTENEFLEADIDRIERENHTFLRRLSEKLAVKLAWWLKQDRLRQTTPFEE